MLQQMMAYTLVALEVSDPSIVPRPLICYSLASIVLMPVATVHAFGWQFLCYTCSSHINVLVHIAMRSNSKLACCTSLSRFRETALFFKMPSVLPRDSREELHQRRQRQEILADSSTRHII